MRRAKAYSSSCSQVILFYIHSFFSQFSFFAAKNRQNITKTSLKHLFLGSVSFKVINVDNPKKLIVSACYVKQHVCAYLQPFSR